MHPVEKLRRIWTPEREIDEIFSKLEPGSVLDSMIRDFFYRIIDQHHNRSVRISLEGLNYGNIRWEVVRYEPMPGVVRDAEATIWLED
jgi:hypothetical protein